MADTSAITSIIKLTIIMCGVIIIGYFGYKAVNAAISNVQHNCGNDKTYSSTRSRCEPTCSDTGQIYDVVSNLCDCKPGYVLQSDGSCGNPTSCTGKNLPCPPAGGQCYDPSNATCLGDLICSTDSIIPPRQEVALVQLASGSNSVFTFLSSANTGYTGYSGYSGYTGPSTDLGSSFVSGDQVTVWPNLKYNKTDYTTPDGKIPTSYYLINKDGQNVSLSTSSSGTIALSLDPGDTIYSFTLTGSQPTCCPSGYTWSSTYSECQNICPGGDICKGATANGCCPSDSPKCDVNQSCCTADKLSTSGTCCKKEKCGGECCDDDTLCCGTKTGGCGTGSPDPGLGAICGGKCSTATGDIVCATPDEICASHKNNDSTFSGACVNAKISNNWDATPIYYPPQVNGKNTCLNPADNKIHYCAATQVIAKDMTYTVTYNYTDPNTKDQVTDIDCAAHADNDNVYSTRWDKTAGKNGQCVAHCHCGPNTNNGSASDHLPLCSQLSDDNDIACPLQPGEIGQCCQRSATSGIIINAPGGIRASDAPDCKLCSGHGTYTFDSVGKCTCDATNNPGWAKSPYTGPYCDIVNAHCTDWMGTGAVNKGGSCPHLVPTASGQSSTDPGGTNDGNYDMWWVGPKNTVTPAFACVPGAMPDATKCPAEESHAFRMVNPHHGEWTVPYNWQTSVIPTPGTLPLLSPPGDPITCQADLANIICIQGQAQDGSEDNPKQCSIGWDPGDPYKNFPATFTTRCSAPVADVGSQMCDYNGVKGCQAPGNFVFTQASYFDSNAYNDSSVNWWTDIVAPNWASISGKFTGAGTGMVPGLPNSNPITIGPDSATNGIGACPCSAQGSWLSSTNDVKGYGVSCPPPPQ